MLVFQYRIQHRVRAFLALTPSEMRDNARDELLKPRRTRPCKTEKNGKSAPNQTRRRQLHRRNSLLICSVKLKTKQQNVKCTVDDLCVVILSRRGIILVLRSNVFLPKVAVLHNTASLTAIFCDSSRTYVHLTLKLKTVSRKSKQKQMCYSCI